MGSPYFSLFEDDQDSRFLDLFNRFSSQSPGFGNEFVKEDDPDLLKYRELISSPTGSEKLISDYVESRPTREDFAPGLGRKLLATLVGGLSGSGGIGAQKFLDQPYQFAEEEWTNEGKNIASRARLIDAERSREVSGLKTALQMKNTQGRAQATDEYRRQQEARRIAAEVQAEEERKRKEEDAQNYRQVLIDMRNEGRDLQREMFEFRKNEAARDNTRQDNENKLKQELAAAKAQSIEQINKDLASYASTQGYNIDDFNSVQDLARELAIKKAKSHAAFGDMISEVNGQFKLDAAKNPERARILEIYLKSEMQKLLKGNFPRQAGGL